MTAHTTHTAGDGTSPATVKVWDPLVRVFHWSLAAGMAYEFIFEPGTFIHNTLGQVLLVLVAVRVVWGFAGTKYARFSDFVTSPLTAIIYLKDVALGHPNRFVGHNPAGGMMVLLLLAAVATTAGSGWLMTTDALWGEEWIEDLHESVAWVTLALIAGHVVGVILASIQHKENLVRSMVTGRKAK